MNEQVDKNGIYQDSTGGYRLGDVVFYPEELTLWKQGKRIPLPRQQARILEEFLKSSRMFLTQKKLVAFLWPESVERPEECSGKLSTAIDRLKKALKVEPRIGIDCAHGVGYGLLFDYRQGNYS